MAFRRLFIVFTTLTSWLSLGLVLAAEPADKDAIKQAIQLAIPYLQDQGAAWISQRGCVSCHQVPAMLWSLSAAKKKGFQVDVDRLRDWQNWSTQAKSFVAPAQKSEVDVAKTLSSNIDTINGLLLALEDDVDVRHNNWRTTFTDALVDNQKPDGSWQVCGQLPMQKRPKQETTQVTVLWTLLTLERQQIESHDSQNALKFAENQKPLSTEWWVARLLLASESEDDPSASIRKKLLSRQHGDGGWGWISDEPSDALATGMALYAIRKTANSPDSIQAAQAATKYLTSTQGSDGSWSVPGTKNQRLVGRMLQRT